MRDDPCVDVATAPATVWSVYHGNACSVHPLGDVPCVHWLSQSSRVRTPTPPSTVTVWAASSIDHGTSVLAYPSGGASGGTRYWPGFWEYMYSTDGTSVSTTSMALSLTPAQNCSCHHEWPTPTALTLG